MFNLDRRRSSVTPSELVLGDRRSSDTPSEATNSPFPEDGTISNLHVIQEEDEEEEDVLASPAPTNLSSEEKTRRNSHTESMTDLSPKETTSSNESHGFPVQQESSHSLPNFTSTDDDISEVTENDNSEVLENRYADEDDDNTPN